VGKAGYLSTYTEIHEFLSPYRANRWVGALQNGVLVLKRKSNLHELGSKQYYHRASDIAALTRHTPAKGLTGKLRRFLRVSLTDAAWSSSMVFRINRSISRLISRGSIKGRGARQSSVR
jgi:hypothetical protein